MWLRRLPTDRIRRSPPEALVIAAPVKGALRLTAVDDAAAALGLKAGMSDADLKTALDRLYAGSKLQDKAVRSAWLTKLETARPSSTMRAA